MVIDLRIEYRFENLKKGHTSELLMSVTYKIGRGFEDWTSI
jgi:hypothetical protein